MKNSLQSYSQRQTVTGTQRVYVAWITKWFFTLACVIFLSSISKAQVGAWTLLKSESNVSVYYKTEVCAASPDTIVYVRIVNSGSTSKSVSWSLWGGTPGAAYTSVATQERFGSCASGPFLAEAVPPGKTSADMDPNIIIE